jgi:hypothetical protein
MLFRRQIEELDLTASELHRLLLRLQAERALAVDTGVAEAALFMADLDEETVPGALRAVRRHRARNATRRDFGTPDRLMQTATDTRARGVW